ncbi:MAG TPA: hypothetical protein PKD85_12140, partial [Saprospiraceae bacterium]|nr:hypothetical protein [Saprospiraceae bacterium]
RKEGRLFSSLDTSYISGDTLYAYWHKSEKIYVSLEIDSSVLSDMKYLPQKINLDSNSLKAFHHQVLEFYSTRGYPFVKSSLITNRTDNEKISIQHRFDKGIRILWDTLTIPDTVNIKRGYLGQILNIREGRPFDKKQLDEIKNKMRNLPFVQLKGDPQVKFIYDKASVVLPLANKPASRFDFIIGVLPGNDGNRRVWNINGEFTADMLNKFGYGERLSAVIKRLSLEDQLLKIGSNIPFILGSEFGFDGDFELRRNRNLTIDVLSNIGAQYTYSNNTRFKAYWNTVNSSLININTTQILAQKRLPRTLDYSLNGGGLEFWYNNLDYLFNPRKGSTIRSNVSLGQRKIIKNQEILNLKNEDVDFSNAYDTINLKNVQLGVDIEWAYFAPVSNWAVNKVSLTSGLKYNNDRVVENELYRIGGNRLMRGFDELTLLTNFYAVATSEFRLILDQNSFLSLPFFDIGFLQSDSRILRPKGVLVMGVGLGLNFS